MGIFFFFNTKFVLQDKVIKADFAFIFFIILLIGQNGQSGKDGRVRLVWQCGQGDMHSENIGFVICMVKHRKNCKCVTL